MINKIRSFWKKIKNKREKVNIDNIRNWKEDMIINVVESKR